MLSPAADDADDDADDDDDGENPAVPAWVPGVLASSCAGFPALVSWYVVHCAVYAYSGYAATRAIEAADLVNESDARGGGCATRAGLFFYVVCAMAVVDPLVSLGAMSDPTLASPWGGWGMEGGERRRTLRAARDALLTVPVAVVASGIMLLLPIVLWLRRGLGEFAVAAGLMLVDNVGWQYLTAVTYTLWAMRNAAEQRRLQDAITAGDLTPEGATERFSRVNAQRKALGRAMEKGGISFALVLLQQVVLLYDFELRPWAGWPFFVLFVTNCLSCFMLFDPWIGLGDWPDELAVAVMESERSGWTGADRAHFCARIKATRVNIRIFEFEMNHGFRSALIFLFFGWWLYMTELRQFHEFHGFSFDQMCVAAAGDEGHHGHHTRAHHG